MPVQVTRLNLCRVEMALICSIPSAGRAESIEVFPGSLGRSPRRQNNSAALHRPREENLGGSLIDSLRNREDKWIFQNPRLDPMTERGESQHHDSVAVAELQDVLFREIWMRFDLDYRRFDSRLTENRAQLFNANVRQ